MSITTETRKENYSKLDRNRLYDLILNVLLNNRQGLTAREIAIILYDNGELISNERQATAPRLTELVSYNKVKVVGKKTDVVSNKKVAVYSIC